MYLNILISSPPPFLTPTKDPRGKETSLGKVLMNIVLLMHHGKLQLPCLGSCWPTEDEGEGADGGLMSTEEKERERPGLGRGGYGKRFSQASHESGSLV